MNATIDVARVADGYFSLKTLAGYSGLSVRRLRDHLTDRRHPLPFYRIGGKILVRRSDFDAWAAQFRRDSQAIDALVDDLVQGL
jgi:excisionase family DNA binding protein